MPLPELWTPEKGAVEARKNAILSLYGTTKAGKTAFCTSTKLPLYYAHFDPNDNLNEHLLARAGRGVTAPAYPRWYQPIPYRLLTQELAQEYVETLLADIAAAKNTGEEGLFVIDGGKKLKGYIEKWKLGESTTLGFRAEKGSTGPSQIEYGSTNQFLGDIISSFAGSNLHLVVTFEGKEQWVNFTDDRGRRASRSTGKIVTSMPQGLSFALNAQIEALVEAEKAEVVDNKQTYKFVHKLRFDWLGFVGMGHLRDRTLPAMSFDDLLDLLHSNVEEIEAKLDPVHQVARVDMSDLEGEGVAE